MNRLIHQDPDKPEGQPEAKRPPKEAKSGGQALKIVLVVALFAASAYILYAQGLFGGVEKSTLPPPKPIDAAQAKQWEEDQRRYEEESRRRQRLVEEGKAPQPIKSQNN